MEANVAKCCATLMSEYRSHRLGCTAEHTRCVWLLTEVCLSVDTVDEHSTLLDITVLLKKLRCLSIYWNLSQLEERFYLSLGRQSQLFCKSVPFFRGFNVLRDVVESGIFLHFFFCILYFNYLVCDSSPLAPFPYPINIDRPHLQYLAVNIHFNIISRSIRMVLQVIPFLQVFNP